MVSLNSHTSKKLVFSSFLCLWLVCCVTQVFGQQKEGVKSDTVPVKITKLSPLNNKSKISEAGKIGFTTKDKKTIKVPGFGEIDEAQLEMRVFEADTSAVAVVLVDDGEVGFDYDQGKYYFTYHTQIKILTAAGFDYADVELGYEGKRGLNNVSAATYNLKDGKMVTTVIPEDKMLMREVVDDYRVLTVPFSDVVEGSIIEYAYTKYADSPFAFLPWYFQTEIPVLNSTFSMGFRGSKDLKPRLYGYNKLNNYNMTFYGVHTISMTDIPAFRDEPYVKNIQDHYSKVVFEFVSSYADDWESLIDVILDMKDFGNTLKKLNAINRAYPKGADWSANEESLKEIHAHVASHFDWNGKQGLIFSDKPKKIWDKATGTTADINLVMLMLLRKAGFIADPVFLSTTDNGLINPEFPTFRQFSNVVVKVELDDKSILVDATDKFRPYNVLPEMNLNGSGLVIKQGEQVWVPLDLNGEMSIQSVAMDYEIDEFGEVSGNGSIKSPGAAGASIKAGLANDDESELEKGLQSRLDKLELSNVIYTGIDDPYATLKRTFDFSLESHGNVIGDRIFFTPVLLKELENNPFKSAKRTLAIDFPLKLNRRYFFDVKIPEGYELEEFPETAHYTLPQGGGTYSYMSQKTEGGVTIAIRFTVNKLMFHPDEYGAIRKMFNMIIEKQEERIVLKKK